MMKEVLGGNYVAQESVRRALAPANDGTMKAILDVGSGAGIW
jgi:16S rRNA G527 N7-methylase RsmG